MKYFYALSANIFDTVKVLEQNNVSLNSVIVKDFKL